MQGGELPVEPGPETRPRLLSRRALLFLGFGEGDREPEDGYWIRVHRRAMACRFEVTLSDEDAHHVGAAREALDAIDAIESVLTVFRDTSALVELNRRAEHETVVVDQDLFDLLRLCRQIHEQTEGAYDPTSTPLSRCWGFLHRTPRLPAEAEITEALARVGLRGMSLDEATRGVRFTRPGLELNLGAIGKGYALDRVGALLRQRGVAHALLSGGSSSVLAVGGRDKGFSVDLRPRQALRRQARLRLRDAALGTSGAGEQFLEVEGKRYGHVLDPRTGWPSSGVLSATVIAAQAAVADALSTAFLVGGPDLASRYCSQHPDTLALITLDDGSDRPRIFGACAGAVVEEA
jgi:thiamine biosynthesis lipoprotein